MNVPKMILFDYGNTLCHEDDFDSLRGEQALFSYITKNPNHYTPADVDTLALKLFQELEGVRQAGGEHHERQMLQLVHEYLGVAYSLSWEEQERVFWDGASLGGAIPGVAKMLSYLRQQGIRTGVISNIGFSGNALTARLKRLIPDHEFEFVIASSEYLFRKPSHWLFELALHKAELPADAVWFCGDNTLADGVGASSVGMFPVWYEQKEVTHLWTHQLPATNQIENIPHLHIEDWAELVDKLENLK